MILPQLDHGDGCNGTGYHIHNNQFAYSTHSWAHRVVPGTRRSLAQIATSNLQNRRPQNNQTQITSKTLIKTRYISKP